jgi:lipopolysaccharide transport system permease protein
MATAHPQLPPADLAPPLRVVRPTKRRLRLRDLWSTRRVSQMIGQRDIKVKYKQAALGPLWLAIAPLGMLAAISIAFSGVTAVNTGDVPYVLFALVGLVVWTYLQLSISVGSQAIVYSQTLVRRSAMPRLSLVVGSLIGNLPPLVVMLVATLGATLVLESLPVQALLVPLLVAWLIVFVGSLTLLVSAITVRFRDVIAVIPLMIQAGLFVTPVGYPIAGAPENIKLLLSLNPASGLIEAWRWSVLDISPDLWIVAAGGAWTVVLAVAGWYVFTRLEVTFADVV